MDDKDIHLEIGRLSQKVERNAEDLIMFTNQWKTYAKEHRESYEKVRKEREEKEDARHRALCEKITKLSAQVSVYETIIKWSKTLITCLALIATMKAGDAVPLIKGLLGVK